MDLKTKECIWEILENEMSTPLEEDTLDNSYTLVVGSPTSGKSTAILQFMNPNKETSSKPTGGLNYSFCRKNVHGSTKTVAHLWELAVTQQVKEMIRIPITPERIDNARIVLMLDMSTPGNVMPNLMQWIKVMRSVLEKTIGVAERIEKGIAKKLKEAACAPFLQHTDKDDIIPFPIPLLLLLGKYDVFCDEESVKRKVLITAIRYIAHMNGISIQAFSIHDKTISSQYKSMMNRHVFGLDTKINMEIDSSKGLTILCGSDDVASIGIPRGARKAAFDGDSTEDKMNQWIEAVSDYFPKTKEFVSIEGDKESDDLEYVENPFSEPAMDALRMEKSNELERYRKEVARLEKLSN